MTLYPKIHYRAQRIQLFQKTLSKEKQTSHKPRPQRSMGSFKSVLIAPLKLNGCHQFMKRKEHSYNSCFVQKHKHLRLSGTNT